MAETHPLEPMTVYGASKLAGELYTKAFYRTYGLAGMIVRPFNTYGPREPWQGRRAEVIPRFILQARAGRRPTVFGDGSQTRDFTYVDDTVEGILLAAECDALIGDVVNIARGEEVSIARIADLITEQLKTSIEPDYAPARPGDVARHLADVSKARRLLGFTARTDIRSGLARCLDWTESTWRAGAQAPADAGDPNWQVREPTGVKR
jgi:UDP-glucose 4-epimerase